MNSKLIPLLALNFTAWGAWGIMLKLTLQRLHPLQAFIIGSLMSLLTIPVYVYCFKASNISNPLTVSGVLLCCCASLLSTIGNIAYIYGIKSGELGSVSVLCAAYPMLTVALAVLFLGETMTLTKIIGIVLVMSGVMVLGR